MIIEPVSVADAVANELRRRLLAGEYPGGKELRDTELTEAFGAARPTIRAAVQMLVADGLLERGRGAAPGSGRLPRSTRSTSTACAAPSNWPQCG